MSLQIRRDLDRFRKFGAIGVSARLDRVEDLLKPVERRAGMQGPRFGGRGGLASAGFLSKTGHEPRCNISGTVERPFSGANCQQRFEIGIGTMAERILVTL